MKIKNCLSHGIISLKIEFIPTLSIEAQGILSQMVNIPNCDYITIRQFHCNFPTESIQDLKKAFDELEKNNYIFKNSDNAYAVNKMALIKKMHWIEPRDGKEVVNANNQAF